MQLSRLLTLPAGEAAEEDEKNKKAIPKTREHHESVQLKLSDFSPSTKQETEASLLVGFAGIYLSDKLKKRCANAAQEETIHQKYNGFVSNGNHLPSQSEIHEKSSSGFS